MKTPKITIGMATYNDFEGVWHTVQSIFLHNEWEDPDDVQLVIVDNSPPGSEHRQLVKDFLGKGGHPAQGSRTRNIKYIDQSNALPSTTLPRETVFNYADAPIVMVMDCHVMLPSNTILKLVSWFLDNQDFHGLVHGPIMYDNLHTISTHFDDQFRGGMWGTWGNMWVTPQNTLLVCHGQEVTDEPRERVSDGKVTFYYPKDLVQVPFINGKQVTSIGEELPTLDWPQHELALTKLGWSEAGRDGSYNPFPIPGQGMGLFACKKSDWVGFNKYCSGFGGEEMNIHLKFRQAGMEVICLPFLKWNHRFGRSGGTPYPTPLLAKIRNYVLWATELHRPDILDRIRTHFNSLPENTWQALVSDPINFPVDVKPHATIAGMRPLDLLFQEQVANSPDMKDYCDIVRGLALRVDSIRAFVKRTAWEPVLASGYPNKLEVFQEQENSLIQRTHDAVKEQHVRDNRQLVTYSTYKISNKDDINPLTVEPAKTGLLVLDKVNTAEYLSHVLNRHGVLADYIMIRGTAAFGEKAEHDSNQPGLYYSIKTFIKSNPEWYVYSHYGHNYGMTVLCKLPGFRPEKPVVPWPKGYGPGTELKAILGSVGINPAPGCDCNKKMRQMDEWGVEGCEANFDTIVGWLEESAEAWGWTKKPLDTADTVTSPQKTMTLKEKLAIGWKSLTTGIAFHVNWVDPYPGLVRESITRAKIKGEPKE